MFVGFLAQFEKTIQVSTVYTCRDFSIINFDRTMYLLKSNIPANHTPAKNLCGSVGGGFFRLLPVAGQEFVDLVGRMSADAGQDIPEVCKGVNLI